MTGDETSQIEKAVKRRLGRARTDRDSRAPYINEVMRQQSPWRRRIGERRDRGSTRLDEIDDSFDNTMMEAAADFASDIQDLFTPTTDYWLKFEAAQRLSEAQKKEVAPQVAEYRKALFDAIWSSPFAESAPECYIDLTTGTMAVNIEDPDSLESIACRQVPLPDLLFDTNAWGGIDGRWIETTNCKREIKALYGSRLDKAKLPPDWNSSGDEKRYPVIDGWHRDWDHRQSERWVRTVWISNKLAWVDYAEGPGAPATGVARWRADCDSGWGVGVGMIASPKGRVLDELVYLTLTHLAKAVNPAFAYDEDGIFNPEGGIFAGTYLARARGSTMEELQSSQRFDVAFFEEDRLKDSILSAYQQDAPRQRGKTPPTAEQWADERVDSQRRLEIARPRITREWVMWIVQRFAHLLEKRGDLPDVELDGAVVKVRPVSPLSKARDLEAFHITSRVMAALVQWFGPQQVALMVDSGKVGEAIKKTLDERHIEFRDPNEIMELVRQAAQGQGVSIG